MSKEVEPYEPTPTWDKERVDKVMKNHEKNSRFSILTVMQFLAINTRHCSPNDYCQQPLHLGERSVTTPQDENYVDQSKHSMKSRRLILGNPQAKGTALVVYSQSILILAVGLKRFHF